MPSEEHRALFQGATEGDIRFQFEIIKGLSESIRDLASSVRDMQKTQVGMLERLATLEANKVGEAVATLALSVTTQEVRIDELFAEKYKRDGAFGMLRTIKDWAPFLAMLFSAACMVYLAGRATGLVPAPPATVHSVARDEPSKEVKIDGQ